jgi:hypothetical protein
MVSPLWDVKTKGQLVSQVGVGQFHGQPYDKSRHIMVVPLFEGVDS